MASLKVICMPTSFNLPCHRSILNYSTVVPDYMVAEIPPPMSMSSGEGGECGAAIKPRSLGDLPVELLVCILKQLEDMDRDSLANARLVSRGLNHIITPIFFEEIALSEVLLSQASNLANVVTQRMFNNIFEHTRNIAIRSDLDLERVQFVLGNLHRCSAIRWIYIPHHLRRHGPETPLITPSQLLLTTTLSPTPTRGERIGGPLFHHRHPSLRLDIENLNLRDLGRHRHQQTETDFLNHGILPSPAPLLRSLTLLASPSPLVTTAPLSLLNLLLRCRGGLETLHYGDRGRGSSFDFPSLLSSSLPSSSSGQQQGQLQKLPAFKSLTLESYDWNHSPLEVNRHWDFSRLRNLRLLGMPLFPFLSSVGAALAASGKEDVGERGMKEALGRLGSQLEVLQCDDRSAHLLPDRRGEATGLLRALVSGVNVREERKGRLEELRITCHTRLFGSVVEGLARHKGTLQTLRFRDHVGFQDEGIVCPTLGFEELEGLGSMLGTRLKELELDMDIRDTGGEGGAWGGKARFLGVLCRAFKSLDTLTLHVQTVHRPEEEEEGDCYVDGDLDCEEVVSIFQTLLRGREGALDDDGALAVPWRRITLNVGGWQRVLVRRMSQAWGDLRRHGINAERCFILERDESGKMIMREESAIER